MPLLPDNTGYQVRYNPKRVSEISDNQNSQSLSDAHMRMAYNGELALQGIVGNKPTVKYMGGTFDPKPKSKPKPKPKAKG